MSELQDFLSWLDGLTEFMDGPPNEKQWAAILKRIETLRQAPHEEIPRDPVVKLVEPAKPSHGLTRKQWRKQVTDILVADHSWNEPEARQQAMEERSPESVSPDEYAKYYGEAGPPVQEGAK